MEKLNWQRTRDILVCIICIGVIAWFSLGLLLGLFVHAVVLLLLSMAIAFLMTPAVNFLETHGIQRAIATLIVVLLVLMVLGGLSYALIATLIRQVQTFSNTITTYVNDLPNQLSSLQHTLVQNGIPQTSINNAIDQIQSQVTGFAQSTVSNVLNLVFIVTNTFIDILLILVLSFYFTVDGKSIRNNLVGLSPQSWMPHVLLFEDALNRVVGNYIRGQLTLAVIIGVLAGGGCLLPWLGLSNYALIIGVLAFLFETIPMVGPALASIPAILLTLLLPHPLSHIFWVVGYFIFIQMFESNVLGPRIVGHAVGLHPVASILALIIGAQLFGAFGALLATPIVAAAWVVIASLYRSARGETADQMLAKRRKPWVIRRPTTSILRVRRDRTGTETGGVLGRTKPLFRLSRQQAMPVEQIELLYPLSNPNEQRVNGEPAVLTVPVKETPAQVDQIDLLRSIPHKHEQPSPPTHEEEET